MRKLSVAAIVCAGALAFAAPANSAPLSAAGSLGSETTRAAVDEALPDNGVTNVHDRRGRGHRHWHHNSRRHHGWNRGHHYGWRHRHHHYGWAPRHYAPRYYGYGPRPYRYY